MDNTGRLARSHLDLIYNTSETKSETENLTENVRMKCQFLVMSYNL